jgi:hypothetical protein
MLVSELDRLKLRIQNLCRSGSYKAIILAAEDNYRV